MSAGHGFISGLLSALLGIAGFGLVLSLRFPEQLMFGDLRSLYASPYLRAVVHLALVTAFLFGSVSAVLRANKTLALTGLGFTLAAAFRTVGRPHMVSADSATSRTAGSNSCSIRSFA